MYCNAGDIKIKNNASDKVVTFGNSKIGIALDYNGKHNVSGLDIINNQNVISGTSGIFSKKRTLKNE